VEASKQDDDEEEEVKHLNFSDLENHEILCRC